ncbi:hypothetical protein GCM10009565_53170 [Amycolatopsis albidoflavus]
MSYSDRAASSALFAAASHASCAVGDTGSRVLTQPFPSRRYATGSFSQAPPPSFNSRYATGRRVTLSYTCSLSGGSTVRDPSFIFSDFCLSSFLTISSPGFVRPRPH